MSVGRSWYVRILVAVVCMIATVWLANTRFMLKIENTTYDLRADILSKRIDRHPDIVLIAIDEYSMQNMEERVGHWPWPREVLGQIGDYVSEAKVVCYDIMMSEPSGESNQHSDRFFEDFADIHNVVIPVALPHSGAQEVQELPDTRFLRKGHASKTSYPHFVLPYPELLQKDILLGHVRADADDGVVRRYQMAAQVGDNHILPSLALQAVLQYEDNPPFRIGSKNAHIGDRVLHHTDGSLFYYEPSKPPITYHASDILDAWEESALHPEKVRDIKRSDFAGKIVLIGGTAEGLEDTVVVPAAGTTFGPLIHAAAMDNLLSGKPIRCAPKWVAILLVVLLLSLNAVHYLNRPMGMTMWFLVLALLIIVASVVILLTTRWMIPLLPPILALLIGSSVFGTSYWQIERTRRRQHEVLEVAKQSFTDMLVHDLKNSLTPIMMFVDFVRINRGNLSTELLMKLSSEVDISSRNTLRLVENLLDIRRIEEGRLPLKRERVDVHTFLSETRDSLGIHAERIGKELALRVEVPAGVTMDADPAILKRVMENLIWNSVKYSIPNDRIELQAMLAEQELQIVLINRCDVIPKATLDILFDAFVSGEVDNENELLRSTGLGLAFCKLAIEAHGNTITACSPAPGREDGIEIRFGLNICPETE